MRRLGPPFVFAVLALVGCSSGSSQQADTLLGTADSQLAQGQLSAAHASYVQALGLASSNPHAAAGAAVTGALLLPDSKPVTDLLDQCGQPHFDVEHQTFGASGVLAQAALARSGTATVQLKLQSTAGAAFESVPFAPSHVRAIFRAATSTSPTELQVRFANSDPDNANQPQDVEIFFDVDDLFSGDSVASPLTDGTTIDLSQQSTYPIYAQSSGIYFDANSGASGTLVFHGTPASGGAMRLELHSVQLTGCTASSCDAVLQLDGEVDSPMVPPVRIADAKRPFGTVVDELTPRYRPRLVGMLDSCGSAISTDALTQKLAALSPVLDEIRAQLDVALAAPGDQATFTLPKGLLQTRVDLPLNRVDLQALRALVHLGQASIALTTRYEYLASPFAELIADQQRWVYPSDGGAEPVLEPERNFLLQPLATDLNANFLSVNGSGELSAMRSELDSALGDLDAVLTSAAAGPGMLELQNSHAAALVAQLADDAKALRDSSAGLQPAPRNPGYGVDLKAFFDAPPDRQVILARAGLSQLFPFVAGDPDGGSPYARNDRIDTEWPTTQQEASTWSGGTFAVPVDGSSTTCLADSDCPAGNHCAFNGACYINAFELVDPDVSSDYDQYGAQVLLTSAGNDLRDLLNQ